ncbi:MAG: hypothetical protein GY861_09335 [bacterium]|nr:hypothetical protein [bacterium]
MKGYSSLKQFVQDYQFYRIAKKIDPGREGETLTSFFKKRVDLRLARASKRFRNTIKKRSYSDYDLQLIATHDSLSDVYSIGFFVKECFGANYVSKAHYKKILSSNAFKSGRLKRLYELIPSKIETKTEFIRFIKSQGSFGKTELSVIMSQICKNNWRKWLNEMIDQNKLHEAKGRWFR